MAASESTEGSKRSAPARPFRLGLTEDGVDHDMFYFEEVRELLTETHGLEVVGFPDRSPVASEELDRVDAVVTGGLRYDRQSVERVRRCILIVRWGAGYDTVDLDACTDQGIMVANTPEGPPRSVAAAALTLILALTMNLPAKTDVLRRGGWLEAEAPRFWGRELHNAVLGIVGFGRIGRELRRLVSPFGARCLVHDPYVDPALAAEHNVELSDLPGLLARADAVSLHCPLTPETEGLIGERELRQMPRHAVLVNTARGAVVDQEALTRALKEEWIRAAGLDVFADEPLPEDDPLRTLHNVILTPHALPITRESVRRNCGQSLKAVLRVMAGEPPPHLINPNVLDHPRVRTRLKRFRDRFGLTRRNDPERP